MSRIIIRLALLAPSEVRSGLERLRMSGRFAVIPNVWQVTLGVLRMWHRVLFRPETIGTCADYPVRPTWRARVLYHRPLRFPFLLAERAIAPWDFSGLISSEERIFCHLLASHHDGHQFAYDLELLASFPGALEVLRDKVQRVVSTDDARTRWLRDLCVFERYHESLLEAVLKVEKGECMLSPEEAADPDISFAAYLDWCARQPPTPAATFATLKNGTLRLG
ncbi:MAG: hypothetical protein EXR75_10350 [Myxococcales bacterium]|nr:hypothetical protein [Myxococcales bacterium]